MTLPLDEKNLMNAFRELLSCVGFGAALNPDTDIMSFNVLTSVPSTMHNDLPARLLACAQQVCVRNPYGWVVDSIEPVIDAKTTYRNVWDSWITNIVSA